MSEAPAILPDLEAAYDQRVWAPNMADVVARYAVLSDTARESIGEPERLAYGDGTDERLDLYRVRAPHAPVLVFVHGGGWRSGNAREYGFLAETLNAAGIHAIALDFSSVTEVGGDLEVLADQVRRAVIFVQQNCRDFGGDPDRLYLAGHSSGAHLAAVALTTAWTDFGLPGNTIKAGVCVSGIYDLAPLRATSRSQYVRLDERTMAQLSPDRHSDRLSCPLMLAVGSRESPEFQRQARDFATSAAGAGKRVTLLTAETYNHFEMAESLGNPYGVMGRALLRHIASADR